MILLLLLLLFSTFYMFQKNFISAILLRQDLKNLPHPVHTLQLYFNIGSIHQKMESGSTNCVTKKSDYMYVFIHKIQPSHCIIVSVFVKVYK